MGKMYTLSQIKIFKLFQPQINRITGSETMEKSFYVNAKFKYNIKILSLEIVHIWLIL